MTWDFFDKIFCISLPHRADRRAHAQSEFTRVGCPVEFVEGVPHRDGRIGLQTTLHDIFAENYHARNILIFEDDVMFTGADPVGKLQAALTDLRHFLRDRYDLLYFGANTTDYCLDVTPNLKLLHNALSAHAVCYNSTVYDRYMKHLHRVVKQGRIITDWDISDVYLTRIQDEGLALSISPRIATQRPSYSDIEKKYVDYLNIIK